MGGWALAVWACGIAFRRAADRAAAQGVEGKRAARVRGLLKLGSLFNLLIGAGAAAGAAQLLAPPLSLGTRAMVAGVCFLAAVGIAEWHHGNQMFDAYRKVRPNRMRMREFRFRLMATTMSAAFPIGVSAILIGSLMNLINTENDAKDVAAKAIVLAAAFFLWWIQWSVIRLVLLPGRPAGFPMQDWEDDAKELCEKMGTKLNDLMILRTGRPHIAGAFALGGGRIAITDDLLSSLTHEEFLAIIAHEARHFLQRKHTILVIALLTVFAGMVGVFAAWSAATKMVAVPTAVLISGCGAMAIIYPISILKRRQEDDADEVAIEEVGAMPLMTALIKTYAINGRLQDGSSSSIHRGLEDRLRRIAEVAGCDSESLDRALAVAADWMPKGAQVSFSP